MLFEDLIPAIESRPEIWHAGYELFNNPSASDKAWEEIAQQFGCDVDTVEEHWEHLKFQYRKELEKEALTGERLHHDDPGEKTEHEDLDGKAAHGYSSEKTALEDPGEGESKKDQSGEQAHEDQGDKQSLADPGEGRSDENPVVVIVHEGAGKRACPLTRQNFNAMHFIRNEMVLPATVSGGGDKKSGGFAQEGLEIYHESYQTLFAAFNKKGPASDVRHLKILAGGNKKGRYNRRRISLYPQVLQMFEDRLRSYIYNPDSIDDDFLFFEGILPIIKNFEPLSRFNICFSIITSLISCSYGVINMKQPIDRIKHNLNNKTWTNEMIGLKTWIKLLKQSKLKELEDEAKVLLKVGIELKNISSFRESKMKGKKGLKRGEVYLFLMSSLPAIRMFDPFDKEIIHVHIRKSLDSVCCSDNVLKSEKLAYSERAKNSVDNIDNIEPENAIENHRILDISTFMEDLKGKLEALAVADPGFAELLKYKPRSRNRTWSSSSDSE